MDQMLALQTNPQFNQPVKTTITQNSQPKSNTQKFDF